MKKLAIVIIGALLFSFPFELSAKRYKERPSEGPTPIRMPSAHPIMISIDEETGVLKMYFNYAIENLTISLIHNGLTLDEMTISAFQGETVEYLLVNYDAGEYELILETPEGIMRTYYILIEN